MQTLTGYHHELAKVPSPLMQGAGSLFNKIKQENPEFVIEEGKNWAMVIKQGPYSDRDAMIVYKGESSTGDIIDLTVDERAEFLAMMEKYSSWITNEISEELKTGTVTLATGMNLSHKPGQHTAQTIQVPHFHFAVMRKEAFADKDGTIKVTPFEIDLSDKFQRKKFGVRESSNLLTGYIAQAMGKNIAESYMPTTFSVELPDQVHFASQDNMMAYIEIQKEVYAHIVQIGKHYKYHHIAHINTKNEKIRKRDTLGATFSITYDKQLQKYVVLCRVTEKEAGSGTGVTEIHAMSIARVNDALSPRVDSVYPIGNVDYYTRLAAEGKKR